jgi:hypothetical protein
MTLAFYWPLALLISAAIVAAVLVFSIVGLLALAAGDRLARSRIWAALLRLRHRRPA